MLMTTELYERMTQLVDAREIPEEEQIKLEQAVFEAMTAVQLAEDMLDTYTTQYDPKGWKEMFEKVA